jgi:hypothetical protein
MPPSAAGRRKWGRCSGKEAWSGRFEPAQQNRVNGFAQAALWLGAICSMTILERTPTMKKLLAALITAVFAAGAFAQAAAPASAPAAPAAKEAKAETKKVAKHKKAKKAKKAAAEKSAS